MKKTLLFAISALVALSLFGCADDTIGIIGGADGPTAVLVGTYKSENNEKQQNDTTYIDEAIKHAVNGAALAADEAYIDACVSNSSAIRDIVAQIASADYSEPDTIYELKINKSAAIAQFEDSEDGEQYAKLLSLDKFKLLSLATSYNNLEGSVALAATSLLTEREGYVMPADFAGDFALYLKYNSDYSAFVEFSQIGNGVIIAEMTFIKTGVDEFTALLDEILGENYTFTPVAGH